MKNAILIILVLIVISSCNKEDTVPSINVEGYWIVKDTSYVNNATRDLYHLFKGSNAFYRFSFLKTDNFLLPTLKPQSDSLITFYQVIGNQLQLPSISPSTATTYSGNDLLSQNASEMSFARLVILKRDPVTAVILQSRLDTIRYIKVTDNIKIAYFDKFLKQWHP